MENSLNFGFTFSAVGIAIVFVVLVLISLTVALMRFLDEHYRAVSESKSKPEVEKPAEMIIDNTTLVLITAAVTATIKSAQFKINSVKRIRSWSAHNENWSLQGRAVLHGSHVVNVSHENKN